MMVYIDRHKSRGLKCICPVFQRGQRQVPELPHQCLEFGHDLKDYASYDSSNVDDMQRTNLSILSISTLSVYSASCPLPLPPLTWHPNIHHLIPLILHHIEPGVTSTSQTRMLRDYPHQISNLRFLSLSLLYLSSFGKGRSSNKSTMFLTHPPQIPTLQMFWINHMPIPRQWTCIFRYGQCARIAHCFFAIRVGRYHSG